MYLVDNLSEYSLIVLLTFSNCICPELFTIFFVMCVFICFTLLTMKLYILYKSTNLYSPENERCILWNDDSLDIKWPLSNEPIVSEKDRKGSLFRDADFFE